MLPSSSRGIVTITLELRADGQHPRHEAGGMHVPQATLDEAIPVGRQHSLPSRLVPF